MSIFDKLRAWLRHRQGERPGSEQRYDDVVITNIADGTTIRGHDAVKAYLDRESAMATEHGSSIIFQVYRIDMGAKTIEELQSAKLFEIQVDGEFVSGEDTVAEVKKKVRPLLEEASRSEREAGARKGSSIGEADRVTLFFNGHAMQDDLLFYADHFMLLPVWVQVYLHDCEFDQVLARADELKLARE